MSLKKEIQLQIYQPHFKYMQKAFKSDVFALLDIGCSDSVRLIQKMFPKVQYYGVDYHNDKITDSIKNAMQCFYESDLDALNLEAIPDNFFDCIVASHVIEHLHNGVELIKLLATKLKKGGYIFIEYPGKKSLKLPSAHTMKFVKGTVNFYDDPTHVSVWDNEVICKTLQDMQFTVFKKGIRRNYTYMLMAPVIWPFRFFSNKYYLKGSDLWDFLGFAEIVYAKKVT